MPALFGIVESSRYVDDLGRSTKFYERVLVRPKMIRRATENRPRWGCRPVACRPGAPGSSPSPLDSVRDWNNT